MALLPDLTKNITPHFTWREALWLPSWRRAASEQDILSHGGQKLLDELVATFTMLEKVRVLLGNKSITIHCAFRPADYNAAIGGAKRSAHVEGMAVDFSADVTDDRVRDGKDCDKIREILLPKLAELGVRMENNGKDSKFAAVKGQVGAGWVHLDRRPVASDAARFFAV